jgi:hypothetical protein
MGAQQEFKERLKEVLAARCLWLERSDLPKLKEEFSTFYGGASAIYGLFVKKGYITEDPYKKDGKVLGLHLPEAGPFSDVNKRDQLGQRLSQFDNALDYIVHFFQFNLENLTQNNIDMLLALVKYIDWGRLSPEAGLITAAVAEAFNNARAAAAGDVMATTMLTESISKLNRATGIITGILKTISDYNRELYKCDIRFYGTDGLSEQEARIPVIKKKFAAACPAAPFYPHLVEEVLNEDFSPQAEALHEKILKSMAVAGGKSKIAKVVTGRELLVEGLNAIGSSGTTVAEIAEKIRANHELMESRQKGFWCRIRKLIEQITKKEPDPVIYELVFNDLVKGKLVKERINYTQFSSEIEKKSRILAALAPRGSAEKKLDVMEEPQLIEILQRNIKDVTILHKTLTNLDDFFKQNIAKAVRAQIHGIKPELSSLKNAISKASQKLSEYYAQKETEEKLKKFGVEVEG